MSQRREGTNAYSSRYEQSFARQINQQLERSKTGGAHMTRSAARFGIAIAAAFVLAGCVARPVTTPAPAPPPVSPDQDFLNRAATGTGSEIQLGELARQRGYSPAVRSFGAHIAAEHGRIHARLIALAQRLGMVASERTPNLAPMAVLSGPQFDAAFMADQVTDHRQAVTLFEGEAQAGLDPRLRYFAREWVPALRRDLRRAEYLAPRGGR
jgi:putative membrane protein